MKKIRYLRLLGWMWHLHSGGRWRKSELLCFSFSLILQFALVLVHSRCVLLVTRGHRLSAHVALHVFILNFSAFLSDFMVKVVEVSDSSQQKTLRGHEAPVLSVAFDPKDDLLVGKPLSIIIMTVCSHVAVQSGCRHR